MDFNAELMVKFQKNIDNLNEDEQRFYLSIMSDNLSKLARVVRKIGGKQNIK